MNTLKRLCAAREHGERVDLIAELIPTASRVDYEYDDDRVDMTRMLDRLMTRPPMPQSLFGGVMLPMGMPPPGTLPGMFPGMTGGMLTPQPSIDDLYDDDSEDAIPERGHRKPFHGVNFYSEFNASRPTTLAITVHHDIANPHSQNCLDNNASIRNLIALHDKIANTPLENLVHNIIFGIVDAEELVNVHLSGIRHLVATYKPSFLIDFELTAGGKHIVMCKYKTKHGKKRFPLLRDLSYVRMPPNNAWVAAHWNCTSACLALVDDNDLAELQTKPWCERWTQCHRPSDTIERWANIEEMDWFVNEIYRRITSFDPKPTDESVPSVHQDADPSDNQGP